MKKIIAFALSIVLLLGVLPLSASAETADWEETVIEGLLDVKDSINLSSYNVTSSQLFELLNNIYYHYPEIDYYFDWVTDIDFKKSNSNYISSFEVSYSYSKTTIRQMQSQIAEALSPAFNAVQKDWDDTEIALYFHDWLCVNFMYDLRLWSQPGNENHDMYGFLMDSTGVCQSYALTYMYMLRQFDIDSYYVISDEDNHAWNIVEIDNKWYHVDVTHDDPLISYQGDDGEIYYAPLDYVGKARYDYFLCSDAEIDNGKHDNWYNPIGEKVKCGEYTGNDSFKDADSPVAYLNGAWYYLDYEKQGLFRTYDFKNVTKIATMPEYWEMDGYAYVGYFSNVVAYNDRIFYTDSTHVYSYDVDTSSVNHIASLTDLSDGRYIGFLMEGKDFAFILGHEIGQDSYVVDYYTLCQGGHNYVGDWQIVGNQKVKICDLCGDTVESVQYEKPGDVDGNGTVNASDLAYLKLFLAGSGTKLSTAADYNGDGEVNATDLAFLKLHLAGA
jgi:hypothetical protein